MSETVKRLIAVVGAIALVVGAVVARRSIDTTRTDKALILRLVCSVDVAPACQAAATADGRIKVEIQPVSQTYATVAKAQSISDLPFDAWLTSGPWAAMADGARRSSTPLFAKTTDVASTPVELAGFGPKADALRTCPGGAAACTAKGADGPWTALGGAANLGTVQPFLGDPTTDGVALAALAKVVIAGLGVRASELDRGAIDQSDIIPRLKRARPSGVSSAPPEISGAKGGAGAVPVAVTRASLTDQLASRILAATPVVSLVVQVALADPKLAPVVERLTAAVAAALRTERWTTPPAASGLADAGTMAALRDAWASS